MALSGKREAFRVDTIARGLDRTRTTYLKAFGNYVANSATTFEAGMLVSLNAGGEIILHDGTDIIPFGVAMYNKDTTISAAVSAEPIQFAGVGLTVQLANTNLVNHAAGSTLGLRITSTTTGGVEYVQTTDFTYVDTTGVVTHVAGGTPLPTATTVYAWYQYDLTARQLQEDGLNFYNFADDVTIQGDKITVITGSAEIFTTQYNAARPWAINDQVSPGQLAADFCQGLFDRTASSTNTVVIGTVMQLPTADDPFLGIKYTG